MSGLLQAIVTLIKGDGLCHLWVLTRSRPPATTHHLLNQHHSCFQNQTSIMAARRLLLIVALGSAALAAPVVEDRATCSSLYGQCGGTGWTGATCCESGSVCTFGNAYYSQCLPGTASSSSSSTASSTATSSARTSSTSRVSSSSSSSSATTSKASSTTTSTKASTTVTGASTTASYSGNPFSGVQQWANTYYASEISAYAIPTLSAAQASQAAEVAKVPTFQWL